MKIDLVAPISEPSGYSEFSRHLAAGLISAGLDVKIRPLTFDAKQVSGLAEEFSSSIGSHTKPDVRLICMIPPKFKELRRPGVKNIGVSMFEAERLPDGWAAACNEMDRIWVPSTTSLRTFIVSGVKNAELRPPPIRLPEIQYVERDQTKPYTFYSCFQWSERKNPVGLLRAYWAEFSGNTDVVLRLKLYLKDQDQNELQRINLEINNLMRQTRMPFSQRPKVELETRHLSDAEILDFHRQGDCYVSASRGEGLGLGAITAMGLGKPCILSMASGHSDFIRDDVENQNAFVVGCGRSPTMSVGNYAPFYEGTNWWSEPDLGQLANQMSFVYRNRNNTAADCQNPSTVGKNAASSVREIYNFKTNSALIRQALENLLGDK